LLEILKFGGKTAEPRIRLFSGKGAPDTTKPEAKDSLKRLFKKRNSFPDTLEQVTAFERIK
jgi:hypothetical protein